jgi:hypothetical protein
MNTLSKPKFESLIFVCLLLLTITPSAASFGGIRFWLPISVLCVAFYGTYAAIVGGKISLAGSSVVIGFGLFACFVCISIVFNSSHSTFRDFGEILRIGICMALITAGMLSANQVNHRTIRWFLFSVILIELILSLLQHRFFYSTNSVLHYIWDVGKSRSWRTTGTFANPNRLGFFISVFTLMLIRMSYGRAIQIIIFATLGTFCVFLSSSRTSLFILFAGLFTLYSLRSRKMFSVLSKMVVAISFLATLLWVA